MRHYVGDGDDDDAPPPLPDEVPLPYPLATCLELWNAWKEHGVTPYGGGYFDQPRQWRRMIRLMNVIYNQINKAHLDALFPNRDQNADQLADYLALAGGDMREGWEAFAGD